MSETHEGSPGEQPTVRPADRGNEGAPTRRAARERTELAHPERIGPYRILQVLGEGGMGTVYEAEQTETVTRRVALKVVKLGMDTRDVVARFDNERQALAVMDHPGIARVLDAGATDEGRPYFVMELVKGLPLNVYCDRHELSTRQRLELFVGLCRAVQHAHQKGVIHRDLKPSNVLVAEHGGRPDLKVIDFGVAKAVGAKLTEQTFVTQLGEAIGTPAYMSPEQAERSAMDVDTRTDVYSLGVMLYELLVGALPVDWEKEGARTYLDRLARHETAPVTPSTRLSALGAKASDVAKSRHVSLGQLQSELKGDLDWVVMKAMETERARRYETVNGLAMDVERFLSGEPVTARPPSAGYRARKFVNRHRVSVGATVVLVAALAAFAAVASWQAGVIASERDAAREAEGRAARQAAVARTKAAEATAARREAEQRGYVAALAAAQMAFDDGETASVESLLAAQPAELRGWEWRYLEGWMRAAERTIGPPMLPPNALVTSVAFAHDGERFAFGDAEGIVRIGQRGRDGALRELRGHLDRVYGLAFDPSGRLLASTSVPGRVLLWDADSGTLLRTLADWTPETASQAHMAHRAVAFSADGVRLAVGGDRDDLRLWNVATGELVASVVLNGDARRGRIVRSLAFDPLGRWLAVALADRVMLLDPQTLGLMRTLHEGAPNPRDLVVSADGRLVASLMGTGRVLIWDSATGALVDVVGAPTASAQCMAFGPEGRRVIISADDALRLHDRERPGFVRHLRGHSRMVQDVAWSPTGDSVISASESVMLWNLSTDLTPQWQEPPPEEGRPIASSGTRWLLGSQGSLEVRDAASARGLLLPAPGGAPAAQPFEARLDAAVPELALVRFSSPGDDPRRRDWHVLDLPSGRWTGAWPPHPDHSRVVVVDGGRSLAELTLPCRHRPGHDQVLQLRALDGSTTRTLPGIRPEGTQWGGISSHSTSVLLALSAVDTPEVAVVDLASDTTRHVLRVAPEAPASVMAFSPDGRTLAISVADATLAAWDVATGVRRWSLTSPLGPATSMAWSRDGTRIAAAAYDGLVGVYEAGTGDLLLRLTPPESPIRGLAFLENDAGLEALIQGRRSGFVTWRLRAHDDSRPSG